MKKQLLVTVSMTDKMLNHFLTYPFEKDGELALPTQRDNSESRYLNNFVELGLLYEVPVYHGMTTDMSITTFYLTKVGKLIKDGKYD